MQELKKELGDEIMKNRPKLSASSLKTYVSILSNIHKAMKVDGDKVDWFSDNVKEIIEHLASKNDQTKKTSLSALYVLTKKDEYRSVMMAIMAKVNSAYKEQKKSPSQAENWISEAEVKEVYHRQLENALHMLSTKKIFDASKYIEFLLVGLLSGASGLPPRRSMDYGEMMIRNFDTKKDNFYKNSRFYFNKYKTAKTYGLQSIDIPKPFNLMIKRWIKLNPTDYLLYSTNKQKLSSPQINRILNSAFGGKVSTNLLRHIYLSSVYANIPALSSIDSLAEQMGHSAEQALEYIKH